LVGFVPEWCRAQLISGRPATSAEQVVERLLAVQGQDPRGARLSIRARSSGLAAGDVDRALTDDRSLVITWLNRGTLHLVRSEDLALLHALTTPQLHTANLRRLGQEGVLGGDVDRGVQVVVDALADGPQTRPLLRERLASADLPVGGQALVHILMRTCLLGHAVRGPMFGPEQAYVLVRDWLDVDLTASVDRDAALTELARRYLQGHAPASDPDLARWAGLSLGDARRGLSGLHRLHDRGDGKVSLTKPSRVGAPTPRLLGPFDPLLLGWTDRTPITGGYTHLVTDNGLFRPFALVDGRAVATWSPTSGVTPYEELTEVTQAALEVELVDVRRFLGSARYR
jgi:hypothetical protein